MPRARKPSSWGDAFKLGEGCRRSGSRWPTGPSFISLT